jgi:hypothetical protein
MSRKKSLADKLEGLFSDLDVEEPAVAAGEFPELPQATPSAVELPVADAPPAEAKGVAEESRPALSSQSEEHPRKTMTEFDASRAWLSDKDQFEPFYVKVTRPLREALASGNVREDTPILVMERDAGVLALLSRQMSYHHLAQGEMAGEPWLVSF